MTDKKLDHLPLSAQPERVGGDELSGRELDAAIAERVMGFDEVERVGGMFYYHNEKMDRESETGGRWRSPVPGYSTDIAAAMEVVEKFLTDGAIVEMAFSSARWNVLIHWATPKQHIAHARLLPEAICLAALRATSSNEE